MAKVTHRQIIAEIIARPEAENGGHAAVPDFDTYFATVSGGEISASVEKVYDGNSSFPEVLCAPAEIGDITVSRFYDNDVASGDDASKIAQLRPLVGQVYYDLAIYTTDCDLKVAGTERVYPKALLVGLTEPDGDAASGAPATYSLTFSISTVASEGSTTAGVL